MSEALGRIQAAAKRTGGYSRSVLADDLREIVARVASLEAALEKAQFALLYGDKEEFSEALDAIDAALKDAPQ